MEQGGREEGNRLLEQGGCGVERGRRRNVTCSLYTKARSITPKHVVVALVTLNESQVSELAVGGGGRGGRRCWGTSEEMLQKYLVISA